MIPLRDNIPTRRFPIVTVAIIVVNVIVFLVDQTHQVVLQGTLNGQPVQQSIGILSYKYSLVPAYVTGQFHQTPWTPLSIHPAWVTIFTGMFLHASWLHIGGNMLFLWIFGNNVEDVLGHVPYLCFYLSCGVFAALAQIAPDPSSIIPMVGASGAIAGTMGAYIWLFPGARIFSLIFLGIFLFFRELPAWFLIGAWILLQVFDSQILGGGGVLQQSGGVAYLAHVGGFLAGMLMVILLGGRRLLAGKAPAPPPRLRRPQPEDDWPL